MKFGIFHIILRSLVYYRTKYLYQFLITMFLAAVITGSLLTGSSVRLSLLEGNTESLNGTGFIISSGNRYLPASIADRFETGSGEKSEGILEQSGWVRNFSSGESALNVQVFGVENSFFSFNNTDDTISLSEGEAIINQKLAGKLNLKVGDDIIVRTGSPSLLPADSPFAPVTDSYESLVLTIAGITNDKSISNFSLGINQVLPYNVFLPLDSYNDYFNGESNINRILIKSSKELNTERLSKNLRQIYSHGDAGLKSRQISRSKKFELISDRVFISSNELEQVSRAIPESRPVLSYLANSISNNINSTPYSFIAGIHNDLLDKPLDNGKIIINRWLADDLNTGIGDSLKVDYFVEGTFKDFVENSTYFTVSRIIEAESTFNDPELMPEFPGISGSESCRDWDAGAPVDMDKIREKDENYWFDYNGTPKAIINYSSAVKIWGNDFGPATAIRFTDIISKGGIDQKLKGKIDPLLTGLTIIPIEENARNAANNSVDFTSLFLGLGFFILLSSVILLILIVSSQMESRLDQVRILRSLGFNNRKIVNIQFLEFIIIALCSAFAGILLGDLLDNLLIGILNTVWTGAVQTDTLQSYSSISGQIIAFIVTLLIVTITVRILLQKQLKKVYSREIRHSDGFIIMNIKLFFLISIALTSIITNLAIVKGISFPLLWFAAGSLLLISIILLATYLLRYSNKKKTKKTLSQSAYSSAYFRMYPGRAITPVIFLAAGLFIVIITGANKLNFHGTEDNRSSGSGGFSLWGETASPLLYDINSSRGKYEYNLENELLDGSYFLQAKKLDGDDASCLNLNQVKSPPILGINNDYLSEQGAFSFASKLGKESDPWSMLSESPVDNIIYGIADQTVMQWSLYKEVGDTLIFTSESGEELRVILVGGLNSSVFQGHIIIGAENFKRFYPSVSGSTVFLAETNATYTDTINTILSENLSQYGIELQSTPSRLEAFYEVTNTYLDVFISLGGLGMILGVIGMGFVLLRNFNFRKKEYALLLSTGKSSKSLRNTVIAEHILILSIAILAALISAPLATLPSLLTGAEVPYKLIIIIVLSVFLTGGMAILISVRSLLNNKLIENLRKE